MCYSYFKAKISFVISPKRQGKRQGKNYKQNGNKNISGV
nr:MAG TPA: hypothetical protein [Caudoviricetes sp.]